MKLPQGVVTKHKIRDFKIVSLYAKDALTFEEIGKRFSISATRVGQIIYKNKALLKMDREYEKIQRVNRLKRILNRKDDTCVTKDAVDLIDKLRLEVEGKDGSQEHIDRSDSRVIIIRETVVNNNVGAVDADTNPSRDVSRQVLIQRI